MEPPTEYLIGVRLHESAQADDYKLVDLDAHVGDLVMVETANGTAIGEVRRPRRELPESKRERLYRRVVRMASETEVREYRERRERETRAVGTCQQMARGRGLQLKVVDVEMQPAARRVTVYFNADERVDFRELVPTSRASSTRESRCVRSARATRPSSWTASGRAGASSAAPRTSGASSRSR